MSLIVLTEPERLVTVDEVKTALRIEHSDDDDRLGALIDAAEAEFGATTGWLGRALGLGEFELRLDRFPYGCRVEGNDIELPLPPLYVDTDNALAVTYVDGDGVTQTLDESGYALIGSGGSSKARVALAYGESWPTTRWQADAVRVSFWAGYADSDKRAQPLRQAVILHVELHYEGAGVVDAAKQRAAINALLSPFRVW